MYRHNIMSIMFIHNNLQSVPYTVAILWDIIYHRYMVIYIRIYPFMDTWWFPKMGVPLNHPFLDRICPKETIHFGEPPIGNLQYCLVGDWPTPLKNMSSSVGMMTFPIYGKSFKIPWFQTTNQYINDQIITMDNPWVNPRNFLFGNLQLINHKSIIPNDINPYKSNMANKNSHINQYFNDQLDNHHGYNG